jgi:hypothetical protein
MGSGAKVGMFVVALVAAVAATLAIVGGSDDVRQPADALNPAPAAGTAPSAGPVPVVRVRGEAAVASQEKSAGVRLTGTVIDEDEAPVPGATVRALRGGDVVAETKSDDEGSFALACGQRPADGIATVGICARLGAERAGYAVYTMLEDAPPEDDVGEVQLERAVALTARVEDAAGPVAGARVFVGSFFGSIFATSTTDAHGVARFDATPATDAWLFAYAPGRGRARGEIPDGRDPKVPLVLTLTARTIRVSVVGVPESVPLAGQRIAARLVTTDDSRRLYSDLVPPLAIPATGDTGIVSVEDVAADDAVEFRRVAPAIESDPWRFTGHFARPVVAEAHEVEVRVDVPSGQTARWPIVASEVPTPADGTLVTLERGTAGALPTGPRKLVVDGAFLVGAGFARGEIRGLARTPDGAVAQLGPPGSDARFVRPRRVEVTVRDADGSPVEGVRLALRDSAGREAADECESDSDGRATFAGLEPGLGTLDLSARTGAPAEVRWVASVDLSASDARVDVRLERPQEIVLRVTTDGEARLPEGWTVLVGRAIRTDARVVEPAEIHVLATEDDPGAPVRVVLRAGGFCDCAADVTFDPARAPVTVDMPLSSGATLLAEFRPPRGADGIYAQAVLQRLGPRGWEPCREHPVWVLARGETAGARRFDHVPPGRYRLLSNACQFASQPVDVALGRGIVSLRLDLSRGGPARVRVVGPDDRPVPNSWVTVEVPDSDWPMPHVGEELFAPRAGGPFSFDAGSDGECVVLLPGDHPVRLVARHPTLRPDPERGSVVVTESSAEVPTIRLVEGPVIEFAATPAADWTPSGLGVCTVRLFRGAPSAEPDATVVASSDGTRYRAGGMPPGRYTVWIGLPGSAPVVIADVDLRDGVNDLGTIRRRPGCALRVRVTVPPGRVAPPVIVNVTRVGGPSWTAARSSRGAGEVAVAGLGAGRFEVSVTAATRPESPPFVRTVELDGEHDVVLDYAPR